MATYSQLPGQLSLALRRGDEFGANVDFDIDLTGYSVSAAIVSALTGNSAGTMTATVTNAGAGVVNVSMTEAQTSALLPGTYAWRLEWIAPGDVKRTAMAGFVEVAR